MCGCLFPCPIRLPLRQVLKLDYHCKICWLAGSATQYIGIGLFSFFRWPGLSVDKLKRNKIDFRHRGLTISANIRDAPIKPPLRMWGFWLMANSLPSTCSMVKWSCVCLENTNIVKKNTYFIGRSFHTKNGVYSFFKNCDENVHL